jgi:aspartyl-tRNA synthetase
MSTEAPPLRANGYRDTWSGQVLADRVDTEVRVAGWVNRRRDHGGLIFIDLRDRTGIVQLVFNPDSSGESFELAHKLRAEDVLSASGKVVRRSEETVNLCERQGGAALRGDRQPRSRHGGGRAVGHRRRAAGRLGDAALPDRGFLQ